MTYRWPVRHGDGGKALHVEKSLMVVISSAAGGAKSS
jgi:hypothetical protein